MKKQILLLIAVGCLSFTSYSQSKIGGNLVYGTEIEELGIGIVGEFFLKNDLSLAPGFNYYFADDPISFWELNANINYYFSESSSVSVYGLAGLNLARISIDNGFGEDRSDSELGVNIGIGANFDINSSVEPFTEFRYVIGDFDQAVFAFGLKFPLK